MYSIREGDKMITRKKVFKYYFIIISVFAIAFIILGGNQKTNIVTSNINNVKSVLSTRIVKQNTTSTKLVTNVGDIRTYGMNNQIKFMGTLTGYGPDCPGCGGRVACSGHPAYRPGHQDLGEDTHVLA